MERQNRVSSFNKDRSQKETHSEIERKRRERMKMETEFLHRQVPHFQCKDKLSIFLAGADRLVHYTDKLGKREYIINDSEYSQLIINNINGFAVRIRSSDGMILHQQNAQKFLDFSENDFVGKTLYEMAEPSIETKRIISDNLALCESESQRLKNGELISRNFIVGLLCGPNVPLKHCVHGCDGKHYRFVEFCGELVNQNKVSDVCVVFRGLCRSLDPACTTTLLNSNQFSPPNNNSSNQMNNPGVHPTHMITGAHVSLRLCGSDFSISEVVGDAWTLLGWCAQDMLRKKLEDFVPAFEKNTIRHSLHSVVHGSDTTDTTPISWCNPQLNRLVELKLYCNAIRINSTSIYCVVCKLYNTKTSDFTCNSVTNNLDVCPPCADLKTDDNITNSYPNQTSLIQQKTPKFMLPDEDLPNDSYLGSTESNNSDMSMNYEFNSTASDVVTDPTNDWRQLPCNSSFSSLLSGTQFPDLFHPDYLKDLLKEDVTDL